MSAAAMKKIESLEAQLAELKAAISSGAPITPVKMKKEKDPNAPKKPANDWIVFTQRVGNLLKAAGVADPSRAEHFTGPATMVKSFSSMLKGQKPYASWSDDEVLEAFESWESPVQAPRAKKSADSSPAASAPASDTGSVTSEKKERKKPAPKSDEQKAIIAAKRAATIAAKKLVAAGEVAPAIEATPAAAPAAAPATAPAPAKKVFKKAAPAAPAFTLEQLTDFIATPIDGEEFGINARGDVIDGSMEFAGHYDAEKKVLNRSAPAPADWATVSAALV